jgi:hypothetical protein
MLDKPIFKFVGFNPVRARRGAEAARYECDGDWFWMGKQDILKNIRDFGDSEELQKGLTAYREGKRVGI